MPSAAVGTAPRLPIHEALPALGQALQRQTRVVLEAPPGAGKTTVVPLALLDAPWLAGRKILMLEPRRIAARAAASFMAETLGEAVGERVGYRIRFEARVSAATRIEVVTEGILTRLIQADPTLDGVGCVIFDEFHERHLATDLALALCLDAQTGLRDDLRLLVMSATLDGERLAAFLGAERVVSAGQSYPLRVQYVPAKREEPLAAQVARAVATALAEPEGDLLVFLPGKREIDAVAAALRAQVSIDVIALHGDLPVEQQAAALRPTLDGQRRIVLATNVAESSVTLPGVRVVVDSGLARVPRFDPGSGFATLQTESISQDSATQRAGRAARLGPGLAIRLWGQDKRLAPERRPEILDADLAPLALELAAWGGSDLQFLTPPPPGTLAQGIDTLKQLDALDSQGRITAHGRRLIEIGTHPRLGNLVAHAGSDGLAADVLALIEARDPLLGDARWSEDWRERIAALDAWRAGRQFAASAGALKNIDHSARQWRRRLHLREPGPRSSTALGDLLLHAFPDRIAKLDRGERYQLASGRGASLRQGSPLTGEPWLAVSELSGVGGDARILKAAPLDPRQLEQHYPAHFHEARSVEFDARDRVIARFQKRFAGIVLDERIEPAREPDAVVAALLQRIRQRGLRILPFTDHQQRWRQRAQFLRSVEGFDDLPDVSDEGLLARLDAWLAPYLSGISKLDELRADRLGEALLGELSYADRQRIEREAPESFLAPSGQHRKIDYSEAAPVLAIKLQELFGLPETPRIAGGRVALTLHLLSPGGRPIQVTQDLRSFWDRTYADVRKELKGRYPKHPWPDDPWSATATHRAKPRGT